MAAGRNLYGLHPVAEAVRVRPEEVECLWAQEGRLSPRAQALVDEARRRGLSVRFVSRERLRLLSGTTQHQSVVARISSFHYRDLEDLLGGPRPLLLVALDGVQDPRNLGAVLRSAEALGAGGVIIPRDRAAGVTPAASKAAAGAAERVPVARVTNLVRALEAAKRAGAWVLGADPSAESQVTELGLTDGVCFVVGGEEKGLRPLVRRVCDRLVRVPLSGRTPSLNLGAAAAILLYEAARQRGFPRSANSS